MSDRKLPPWMTPEGMKAISEQINDLVENTKEVKGVKFAQSAGAAFEVAQIVEMVRVTLTASVRGGVIDPEAAALMDTMVSEKLNVILTVLMRNADFGEAQVQEIINIATKMVKTMPKVGS